MKKSVLKSDSFIIKSIDFHFFSSFENVIMNFLTGHETSEHSELEGVL